MKIGIIGGSGLDDPKILKDSKETEANTVYGKPSSGITTGTISGAEVCIIARHGKKHTITPTQVNNRANIRALADLGCTRIIATTAVGSLREEIKPGDLVIADQLIDFTRHRNITFHDDFSKGIAHIGFAEPFSQGLRKVLIDTVSKLNFPFHEKGTIITIEGPRFSTKAESRLFRMWGADIINMSIAPEASLAREADIEYAAIAMSTDYDCWKDTEEAVSWEMVMKIMKDNAEKVKKLMVKSIENMTKQGI